tara:strand:- start:251 stop:691 length:441 start_codon:yes stop_codon:yes gene_type:complete
MNINNYNSLDVKSLNYEIDRLQNEIDANNNELRKLISQINIRNAESLNLNFESVKAMKDLRDIQGENISYQDKKRKVLQKFELVKNLKDKSNQAHNKYRELDKTNNLLKELNRILNEQLRRATIRLVVGTYSDSAISNVANTITKF